MTLVGTRVLKVAGLIVTAIVALAAAGAGGWAWYTTTYHSRLVRSLEKAGYQEHRVSVDHVKLNVGVSRAKGRFPYCPYPWSSERMAPVRLRFT